MLLNGDRTVARNAESNLGNWICDAMRNYVATQTSLLKTYPDIPLVCLTNGGGIRASIPAGNVTQGQIITVSPFGNWCAARTAAYARCGSGSRDKIGSFARQANLRTARSHCRLMVKRVNASVLMAALNSGVSGWTGDSSAPGKFPQVGGMKFAFNPKAASAAKRVVNASIASGGATMALEDFTQDILVVTNNFVATGGDL